MTAATPFSSEAGRRSTSGRDGHATLQPPRPTLSRCRRRLGAMLRSHKTPRRASSHDLSRALSGMSSTLGERLVKRRLQTRLPELLNRFYTSMGIKRQESGASKHIQWRVHVSRPPRRAMGAA
ncbi:hypothetical protein AC579_4814 [Pseudocercospora musae]|uniref:Uncharacterized protein n=1 Tax=Pseudocercospora musae TaxID=113226 RepID=A0A139IID0_9PEZI|nr:hypothetical protein AC579_4814 [Pseudocercospora musae]